MCVCVDCKTVPSVTSRMITSLPYSLCLWLFYLPYGLMAIRLKAVDIPSHSMSGSHATLVCDYDLEGDFLYSVKWYKEEDEFFRYVPKDSPPAQVFNVDGVHVDVGHSNEKEVVLNPLELSTSGLYRCEVSAEAPSFETVFDDGEMVVVEVTDKPPTIFGGKPIYHVGDVVNVNCTSPKSKPVVSLMWYINGEEAKRDYLKEYVPAEHPDGLETSMLGLQFRVSRDHFPNGQLTLKCTGTIATVYYKSSEESVIHHPQKPPERVSPRETMAPVPVESPESGRQMTGGSMSVAPIFLCVTLCLIGFLE